VILHSPNTTAQFLTFLCFLVYLITLCLMHILHSTKWQKLWMMTSEGNALVTMAVPYLKWLNAGFSMWNLGINPRWLHVRFVTGKMTTRSFSLRFFDIPLVIIISPLLHTYLPPPLEVCDRPHQTTHYHILSLKVRGFIPMMWQMTGHRVSYIFLFITITARTNWEELQQVSFRRASLWRLKFRNS
jgi:hypothetical protein